MNFPEWINNMSGDRSVEIAHHTRQFFIFHQAINKFIWNKRK